MADESRVSITVEVDASLLEEARALGIDLSRAAGYGIATKIAATKAWKAENREALEAHNKYIEEHGLPLARYRQF